MVKLGSVGYSTLFHNNCKCHMDRQGNEDEKCNESSKLMVILKNRKTYKHCMGEESMDMEVLRGFDFKRMYCTVILNVIFNYILKIKTRVS